MTPKEVLNEVKRLLGMEITEEPKAEETKVEAPAETEIVAAEEPVEEPAPEEPVTEEPKIEEKVAQLEDRIAKLEEAILMITENYSAMDTKYSSEIEKIKDTPLTNPINTVKQNTKPMTIAESRILAIGELQKEKGLKK